MKKAGLSNSKFKVNPLAEALSVGYQADSEVSGKEEAILRSFQSNLLSLVSHELMTPLGGILNAFSALEHPKQFASLNKKEWLQMGLKNARQLKRALASLLDLAALESQTFRARLKEVDLARLVEFYFSKNQDYFDEKGLSYTWEHVQSNSPFLLDPQKMSRALDLLFELLEERLEGQQSFKLRLDPNALEIEMGLKEGAGVPLRAAWTQSLVGFHTGVVSPYSAFAGVTQSEEHFLTRSEEGLGSQLLLIHEIMRVHRGGFYCALQGSQVTFRLEFPTLSPQEVLLTVLSRRLEFKETELGSVSLILWEIPEEAAGTALGEAAIAGVNPIDQFVARVKESLFRTTDAVYPVSGHKAAVIIEDCKEEFLFRIVSRIEETMSPSPLKYGIAHCPVDGYDPEVLLALAEKRLAS